MTQFEYLSVLLSIIIGLGVSHLLSSAARLIQARRHVRFYPPTVLWMCFLLLVQIQVWWVAFERADQEDWSFSCSCSTCSSPSARSCSRT